MRRQRRSCSALTIYEQQLGPDHPDLAFSLNMLADIYKDQGQFMLATSLYQRALYIWKQVLASDHPLVLYLASMQTNASG